MEASVPVCPVAGVVTGGEAGGVVGEEEELEGAVGDTEGAEGGDIAGEEDEDLVVLAEEDGGVMAWGAGDRGDGIICGVPSREGARRSCVWG